MNKSARAVAVINMKNLFAPYLITGICVGTIIANLIVDLALASKEIIVNNIIVGTGMYFYLLILTAPIFIPTRNFRRVFNLGGKRESFFWGSLAAYVIFAAAVSLINIVFFYLVDTLIVAKVPGIIGALNLIEVFGWSRYGFIAAFFQQFAFLFWVAAFIHTLSAAQGKWYGWAANVFVVAVPSVFVPIAVLRKAVVFFFNLIIFSHPALQIASCLLIGFGLYWLSKPVLARKAM